MQFSAGSQGPVDARHCVLAAEFAPVCEQLPAEQAGVEQAMPSVSDAELQPTGCEPFGWPKHGLLHELVSAGQVLLEPLQTSAGSHAVPVDDGRHTVPAAESCGVWLQVPEPLHAGV